MKNHDRVRLRSDWTFRGVIRGFTANNGVIVHWDTGKTDCVRSIDIEVIS